MLRPAMTQILKPGESYYKFVVAVAKKAREISAEAEENHIALEENLSLWHWISLPPVPSVFPILTAP